MANNGSIEYPDYQPAMRAIFFISRDRKAHVITTVAHNYYTTDIVRFYVPQGFGMTQIDGMTSQIESIVTIYEFTVNIDTTQFDEFDEPDDTRLFAQVIPIGEANSSLYGATRNTLPSHIR